MSDDTVEALIDAKRGVVTAAAGCGKTEAIALAVGTLGATGKQLVLTHTHAGVAALKRRMAQLNVPPSHYRIETIAGWCLRLASHYPQLSGLTKTQPVAAEWDDTYKAAHKLIQFAALRDVVSATYAGVFVDEYQDCSIAHHGVIKVLADILPCRVLGDPLQGIFDFDGTMVDWNDDVLPFFVEHLPPLTTPWRWKLANPQLGDRLAEVRAALVAPATLNLEKLAPIQWRPLPADSGARLAAQRKACVAATKKSGDIVAIRRWPSNCYQTAEGLNGMYTCMEEIDCKDLFRHAGAIDHATGFERVVAAFAFAQVCMSGVATPLKPFRDSAVKHTLPTSFQQSKQPVITAAIASVLTAPDLSGVSALLRAISAIPTRRIFRQELWTEMLRAVDAQATRTDGSLRDTAWKQRNHARRRSRFVARRSISRTLLVKGLEFDHSVVLDAEELDAKNLYVAMTRPRHTLVVCSASPKMAG